MAATAATGLVWLRSRFKKILGARTRRVLNGLLLSQHVNFTWMIWEALIFNHL